MTQTTSDTQDSRVPANWRTLAAIKPDQAAELLSISLAELYRRTKSGDIECFRVGRALRIPTRAVLAIVGEAA